METTIYKMNNSFEPGEKYGSVGCVATILVYIGWFFLIVKFSDGSFSPINLEEWVGTIIFMVAIPFLLSMAFIWLISKFVQLLNFLVSGVLPYRFQFFKFLGKYIIAPVIVGVISGYISFLITGDFGNANKGFTLIGSLVTIMVETKA